MSKCEDKPKTNGDNALTKDFLLAAISDLTGNLNLLDTKISIVMATVGAILGVAVACKSNILKAYNYYSNSCILKILFLLFLFIFVLSVLTTFICGIQCIMIRVGKSKSPSLWFFNTEKFGGISEQDYYRKIKRMTNEDINKNLSTELYKLNAINNCKMRSGRNTILFFSISSFAFFAMMIMVGISYLVV